MSLSLQQLRYLIAVADCGSVTAAAREMGVTQPVLSRALAGLQAELGVPLFKRRERRLVLTPEGIAALREARRAVNATDDVRRAVLRKHAQPLLRIVTGTSVGALLAPAIGKVLSQQPEMHVQVIHIDSPSTRLQMVLEDQADLALSSRPAAIAGLEWRLLGQVEFILVSPPDLDLPDPVPLADMADIPQVTIPASARERTFDDIFLNAGIRPNIVVEADDPSIYPSLTVAGVGSFLGVRFCCDRLFGVKTRRLDPPQYTELGLAFTAARRRQVREFVDLSVAAAARWPD